MDFARIRERFPQDVETRRRLGEALWWGLALGIVAGSGLSEFSGFDWHYWYYPMGRELLPERLNNPMWLYFLLAPIAQLPPGLSFTVFTALNAAALWLASRLSGARRFALLLSFPAFWVLWYGQLDGLVALGAALGLWAVRHRRPYLLGLALLLLLAKPHIGAPLAVVYFFWFPNRRTAAAFAAVFLLSLLVWGWDWPLIWGRNLGQAVASQDASEYFVTQQTNISLFPYGLLAWLVPLMPMPKAERSAAVLSATVLSVPYAASYSLLPLLALPVPLSVHLLASIPYLLGKGGYVFTALAPLVTLGWLAYRHRDRLGAVVRGLRRA